MHGRSKIAGFAGHRQDFGIGQNFHIQVLTTIDQAGRDSTHGTVIRREGLVQASHVAADGRVLFYHVDLETGIGQVQRGLHPRNTATDNEGRTSGNGIGRLATR